MNKMFILSVMECRSFFITPVALLLGLFSCLAQSTLFWYLINLANAPGQTMNEDILTTMTHGPVFWFTIFLLVPVLSMRSFAFEHEKGTLPLLLITPLRTVDIVLGKFIGLFLFFICLWLPLLAYVLLLSQFMEIQFSTLWIHCLGIGLTGIFCLSVGLFASALAKSQLQAALTTFFILIFILIFSVFKELLPESILKDALDYLNFMDRSLTFSEKIFDTRDVAYFSGFTCLFLFLTHEIIQGKRN